MFSVSEPHLRAAIVGGDWLIDSCHSRAEFLQPAQPPLSPAEISGPTVSELMSDKFED